MRSQYSCYGNYSGQPQGCAAYDIIRASTRGCSLRHKNLFVTRHKNIVGAILYGCPE
ncbi:MAG: hypothetical protein KAI83_18950 [Thiomargarita sp.]|nr:hypothetical protein [Thiomargarita sp.]